MAAKKPAPKTAPKKKVPVPATRTSAVRNSPVPKSVATPSKATAAAPKRKIITREMIAQRAHEISQSGTGGGELDNWLRAERELQG